MVENILIRDFDYPLPDDKIARFPLAERDMCRLIVCNDKGEISNHSFSQLPQLLTPGSLMICNETRVINARMDFRKPTGSRIEIFLLEPSDPSDYVTSFASTGSCRWSCLVGNLKRWKQDSLSKEVIVTGFKMPIVLTARLMGELPGNAREIEFSWDNPSASFAEIVEAAGNIPIPPYLNRDSEDSDLNDYQTVFSRVQGSVAAPTAGLHFTDRLLAQLSDAGIERLPVVLHVGAGTFQPVKSETIGGHPMHTETFVVTRNLILRLMAALKEDKEIVAVGTTSVRTLESLPYLGAALAKGKKHHVTQWEAYSDKFKALDTIQSLQEILDFMDREEIDSLTASTAIMIAPGFHWRIVKRMITNFHQPQSTLLLLVSSFLEPDVTEPRKPTMWRKIYDEALRQNYRFLSYGDACLFQPLKNTSESD